MIFLAMALCVVAGVAGAVYLTIHGHPFMAFLVLLCGAGVSMTRKKES